MTEFPDVLFCDSSDRADRNVNRRGDIAIRFPVDRPGIFLGMGAKCGSASQIVCPQALCHQRFRYIVSSRTDDFVRPQERPGLLNRQIVLADMYAVCVCAETDFGTVIDQKRNMISVAEHSKRTGFPQKLFRIHEFFSQLQHRDACSKRLLNHVLQRPAGQPSPVSHCVQPQHLRIKFHRFPSFPTQAFGALRLSEPLDCPAPRLFQCRLPAPRLLLCVRLS